MIHCRNAWEDTFRLLSMVYRQTTLRGVFHSWTGNWEAARRTIDLGFYISFSGIVTFSNAPDIQDVAKRMPIDKMLLETDSPYLTPEPMRSGGPPSRKFRRMRQNEPKNVKIVASFIASLRNVSLDELSGVTSRNAEGLFGI